jgi:hypothetical protein
MELEKHLKAENQYQTTICGVEKVNRILLVANVAKKSI